ncbi:uncharacterized protein [Typha latifolia]|uniref:uncharacterized protein n=1 Tax=Typha latifolia TaxID=4733 RepID=UPI003C2EBFBE
MEDSGNPKRLREENSDEWPVESLDTKRMRPDDLIDILDDDEDDDYDGSASPELVSVMKSLEEEIAVGPPLAEEIVDPVDPREMDLGFLLEASDDELGLPPTVASSSETTEVSGNTVEEVGDGRFGQIWGFDDEIVGFYGDLDFGNGEEEEAEEGGLEYGLFDFSDEFGGPFDYSDLSWRPESLPAV